MFKDTLLERSGRNFKGGDILLGAQKYYCMPELEKSALETEFKDYIFFVYGDSIAQQIYPDVPSLYLYAEKRGISDCPWFTIEK